jgi:hypothetical protein
MTLVPAASGCPILSHANYFAAAVFNAGKLVFLLSHSIPVTILEFPF